MWEGEKMDKLRDPNEIKRLMESSKGKIEADEVKQKLRLDGYNYQISIYGVIHDNRDRHNEYRRIEILSNRHWNENAFANILHFFSIITPEKTYSIWSYDNTDETINLEGQWI
jgi:hypothetical protein